MPIRVGKQRLDDAFKQRVDALALIAPEAVASQLEGLHPVSFGEDRRRELIQAAREAIAPWNAGPPSSRAVG